MRRTLPLHSRRPSEPEARRPRYFDGGGGGDKGFARYQEGWALLEAQRILHTHGTASARPGTCPDPIMAFWPVGRWLFPRCSILVGQQLQASQSSDPSWALGPHLGSPETSNLLARQHGLLYRAQAAVHVNDPKGCPHPDAVLWVPDQNSWPACTTWMARKCLSSPRCRRHYDPNGIDPMFPKQSPPSERDRALADVQNWCAHQGKCPLSVIARWPLELSDSEAGV